MTRDEFIRDNWPDLMAMYCELVVDSRNPLSEQGKMIVKHHHKCKEILGKVFDAAHKPATNGRPQEVRR